MPENNSLTDVKYKVLLRARAEWDLTQFTQQVDNPAGLTSAEVAAFAAYRAEWQAIVDTESLAENVQIDFAAENMVVGMTVPELPEGWNVLTRAVGDLPPILIKYTDFDTYDASYDNIPGDDS